MGVAQEECSECRADLTGRADRVFCTNACRQAAYRRRRREARIERDALAILSRWAEGEFFSRNAEIIASRNDRGDR